MLTPVPRNKKPLLKARKRRTIDISRVPKRSDETREDLSESAKAYHRRKAKEHDDRKEA